MTVRVASGEADRWKDVRRVLLADRQGDAGRGYDVENARAYGDRLVLKLRGVSDAGEAAALEGHLVLVPAADVPELQNGTFWVSRLVGFRVVDERGEVLGTLDDVVETGGTDLLQVRGQDGEEILVPMAREIVLEIRDDAATIVVRLPEGLRDLNRSGTGA